MFCSYHSLEREGVVQSWTINKIERIIDAKENENDHTEKK